MLKSWQCITTELLQRRQGQFLGCSFHPELTDDARMAQYFVAMVEEASKKPV